MSGRPTVVTFGELLWDRFPDEDRLGGAPANVAYHLAQAGVEATLASAVGNDPLGDRAVAEMDASGVLVDCVHRHGDRPTGTVEVRFDDDGKHSFAIAEDVAWDAIPATTTLTERTQHSRMLVHGSLALRGEANRAGLATLIRTARAAGSIVVFDLNLRPPFVSREPIVQALEGADILKLNDDEVRELAALLPEVVISETQLMPLLERFNLERIYVTRGAKGCTVIGAGEQIERPSAPVTVVDTVGAGDAFTAGLVLGELRRLPPGEIAAVANELGGFVASAAGAMPRWPSLLRQKLQLPAPA